MESVIHHNRHISICVKRPWSHCRRCRNDNDWFMRTSGHKYIAKNCHRKYEPCTDNKVIHDSIVLPTSFLVHRFHFLRKPSWLKASRAMHPPRQHCLCAQTQREFHHIDDLLRNYPPFPAMSSIPSAPVPLVQLRPEFHWHPLET